jgi:uncharacterized phage-associated protein
MPYDARAIANFFIDLAQESGEPLSPMKLQRLVYFANGWNLAIRGSSLIDEPVEAWSFGPIIRSLYEEFKKYGEEPITEKALAMKHSSDVHPMARHGRTYVPSIAADDATGAFTRSLLNKIWEVYGPYSAIQLTNMTHDPESPWYRVHQMHQASTSKKEVLPEIPDELIRDYFLQQSRRK